MKLRKKLRCRLFGHKWAYYSWNFPSPGDMSHECERCGFYEGTEYGKIVTGYRLF